MYLPHTCYSWSEKLEWIDVNFLKPGFEEFKDEAQLEVAFWTGILGDVLWSRILSVRFNFLFNAISDVLTMS